MLVTTQSSCVAGATVGASSSAPISQEGTMWWLQSTLEVFTSPRKLMLSTIKWSPRPLQDWLMLQCSHRATEVVHPLSGDGPILIHWWGGQDLSYLVCTAPLEKVHRRPWTYPVHSWVAKTLPKICHLLLLFVNHVVLARIQRCRLIWKEEHPKNTKVKAVFAGRKCTK